MHFIIIIIIFFLRMIRTPVVSTFQSKIQTTEKIN